jgi:hypothetical protein
MMLREAIAAERDWTGSMDDLAHKSSELSNTCPVAGNEHLPQSTRALIISYRARQILPSAHGKLFVWDHLVRLLCARFLIMHGWNRGRVAERLSAWTTEFLAAHIGDIDAFSSSGPDTNDMADAELLEQAQIAVALLAAGIVEQFRQVKRGGVLVQDASMSSRLSDAMLLLASIFLSRGRDNVLGSVHELLVRCQQPLSSDNLGLEVFSHPSFAYTGLVLIDPDQRLPTLDCAELARQASSELDLREQLAFDDLRNISEQFVGREEDAYSILRLWTVEHPVTTVAGMRSFLQDNGLQLAASFLSTCYEPVGPRHLVSGELHLCSHCGAPMRRSHGAPDLYACSISQCARFDRPVESVAFEFNDETLVAKTHILLYWIAPGLDEAAVYRRALQLGLTARAYPGRDACDVSLDGDTVGIDIKSYASPYVLASALNRSVGGNLAFYSTRIVAINDQVLVRSHGYLDAVRRYYRGALPLRFMSVRELTKSLEVPF